ncbi:MAG: transcriptional regulator [Actinobacteria bacterium]|nr:MAG: transcriptional regulator [Actinomycetota bacterium]
MASEELFKALAAPQRQQILRLVRDEPLSVGEIAKECDASQQATSHHLQVLKDVGLLAVRRDGQRRLYLVDPDGFESVGAFVAELWPSGLARLKATIEDQEK